MKLIIEQCNDGSRRGDLEKLVRDNSLAEIIATWVSENRSLAISSGSDEAGVKRRAYVVLREDQKDILVGFYEKAELLLAAPNVADFIPPDLTRTTAFEEPSEDDQKFFQRQDELVSDRWDDELCAPILPLETALQSALGLALSRYGETVFEKPSQELLDELECPEKYSDIMAVDANRFNEIRSLTEGVSYYVDLRSEGYDKRNKSSSVRSPVSLIT